MSKKNEALIYARDIGYTVDEFGVVRDPNDRVVKLSERRKVAGERDKHPYLVFGVLVPGESNTVVVSVHRFVALFKFGSDFLYSDLQVCHLNSISTDNSWANISKGTAAYNSSHKSAEARGRKLTDEQAEQIRVQHAEGVTTKALATEYGVDRKSVWNIVNGKRYRTRCPVLA